MINEATATIYCEIFKSNVTHKTEKLVPDLILLLMSLYWLETGSF